MSQPAPKLPEEPPRTTYISKRRRLAPPRPMTGREKRWLDPNRGLFKIFERGIDRFVSRYVFPHLLGLWHPYTWLLPRRFCLGEIALFPEGWPKDLPLLRVLLLSDIHTGMFLKPEIVADIVDSLMELEPDLVAVAGDAVTARASDLNGFMAALAPLAEAPLGAWYCHGNHDYFSDDAEKIRERFDSIGIATLKNESVVLSHGRGKLVLGGIDDLILGRPDWERLLSTHGAPHLLLAHHPDFFYQAAARGVPLTLSGHTHGGQIRFRGGPPILRQSRFCLDEGAYAFHSSLLVVSRGLGSVGLPWRYGADPEAVLIEIQAVGGRTGSRQ
ncbi:MAG TPA: metallophosphoesterase [Candidatus Binatia bacterium]